MFYGVNDQPYIDLELFLDLTALDEVVAEVRSYIEAHPITPMLPFNDLNEVPNGETHLGRVLRLVGVSALTPSRLETAQDAVEYPLAAELPITMAFLRSLPLKGLGLTSIVWNDDGVGVPVHRDSKKKAPFNNSFIYINPEMRPFYIEKDGVKHYVETRAAIFNNCDLHGTDACDSLKFSIRVNGLFEDWLLRAAELEDYLRR